MAYLYGIASAGYMFIQPLSERDKTIEEQKEENLQVCDQNKDLRAENEDLKEDKQYLEKQLSKIEKIVNDYDIAENKVTKIKEVITTANVK